MAVGDVLHFKAYLANSSNVKVSIYDITSDFRVYVARATAAFSPTGQITGQTTYFTSKVLNGLIGCDMICRVADLAQGNNLKAYFNTPFAMSVYTVPDNMWASPNVVVLMNTTSGYYATFGINSYYSTFYDSSGNQMYRDTNIPYSLQGCAIFPCVYATSGDTVLACDGLSYQNRIFAYTNRRFGNHAWVNALLPPPPEVTQVIKYVTAKFKFPQDGVLLPTSLDSVNVDIGSVTATGVTWTVDGSTAGIYAEADVKYTAQFTLTSATGYKFAQAISGYISAINTADTTEVYIESIEGIQPIVGGNILIVKITFSPVGQLNPYDEEELESDPLEEPPNPTITAVDTSFFTAYAPSKSELNALASYMWNNTDNWLDTFNRMFANPMECILGLSIVPVSVSGSPKNVVFGNVETSISMPAISSQYVSVNCGSVRLSEQWRTYLDYNPYTKVRLYLPYCGVHELDTDEVMGRDIAVSYKVDVLNGNVIAYVKDGSQVKWVFSGNCAMQVPVTAQQFVNSSLGYAAAAGNQVTNFVKGLGIQPTMDRNEALQKPGGILNWAPFSPFASFPALGSAVSAVQGSKSNVIHQGNFSGGVGQLSIQTPFLVIERPRPVMANVYQQFEGFPNFASLPLSSCKGFTRVESIHLSGMTCTAEEQAMIEQALKGGVII